MKTKTKIWFVDAANPDRPYIQEAARIIKDGGLVAFPTETVYGLGADGLNGRAVAKIFAAKGRPIDNPLILHIANKKDAFYLAEAVSLKAQVLMDAFWPGPLTLVMQARRIVPPQVTAGLETVAVRMPKHGVALALIREAGVPLAAPSANRSGYPSPTTAQHVLEDLNGRIDAILDGGPAGLGLESTVLDVTESLPVILRPGGVTKEQLEEKIGPVRLDPALEDEKSIPRSPGMKYTHYSPNAEVILLEGSPEIIAAALRQVMEPFLRQGKRIGLLFVEEVWEKTGPLKAAYCKNLGSCLDLDKIASVIYGELRNCDAAGVDVVLTGTYEEKGLGLALMNRLLKSAGYNVIKSIK